MAGATHETIYLDERGTPLLGIKGDGVFVVAGVGVRGDHSDVAGLWELECDANDTLNRKSTRYGSDELLTAADFLCKHDLQPIASVSRLTEPDGRDLREKIEAHQATGSTRGIQNPGRYLWCTQIGMTVAASLHSLAIHRGKVEAVAVALPRYTLKGDDEALLESGILTWLDPTSRLLPVLQRVGQRWPDHPLIGLLRENLAIERSESKVEFRSTGSLPRLADAVCAIYGRALRGDSGAARAWDVLRIRFGSEAGKKAPSCMGMDLTKPIRTAILQPLAST